MPLRLRKAVGDAVERLGEVASEIREVARLFGVVRATGMRRVLAEREEACGGWYVQSLLSQLADHLLAPPVGSVVLDMCAAPGGKTLHLADILEGGGEIVAITVSRPRLQRLRHILRS